ncbi:MAG: hypothetical protein RR539_04860 [Clostridium sp.]|uniref:efflux RND transporter periplasmic adaptor subunit n=1 Tax=Clostridium sp. TaxID=1506 RepID=UPI002FC8024F
MLRRNFIRSIVGITGVLTAAMIIYLCFYYNPTGGKSLNSALVYTVPGKKRVFIEGEVMNTATMSYQIDPARGQISVVYVDDEAFVKKDQLLLSYKNEAIVQQQEMLSAQIESLRIAYDKMDQAQGITKEGKTGSIFASATGMPDLSGQLQGNIQQQDKLREQIIKLSSKAYTDVYAPFSGVVKREGSEGSPIVTVSSSGLHIVCNVSEKDILDISTNQKVTIRINSTGQEINGRIKEVSNTTASLANKNSSGFAFPVPGIDTVKSSEVNHYPVFIEFDKGAKVYPGFHVQVAVDSKGDMPKIPITSVFKEGNTNYVWAVRNGITSKTAVDTIAFNDKYLKVKKGLTFGDKVIRDASKSIEEGDSVESEPNRD